MAKAGRVHVAAMALLAANLIAGPAAAGDLTDWNISPAGFDLAGFIGSVGADASGALYAAHQGGGIDRDGATGSLLIEPSLESVLDNAWELGFRASILAYHDHLSGDNYGNDVFEKAYGYLQTPYGRVEIGQQDGAAYKMVLNGPTVDDPVAINDANVTFFKDPTTGRALNNVFNLRSGVFDSANDAKISYYIPHFFDVQIGVSYTPNMAKGGLPWIDQGHAVADRPQDMWEAGANYAGYFGQAILRGYAGIAIAHNAAATASHDDLRDVGLGAGVDYAFRGAKISVGAGWRRSNAYTFDVTQPFSHGDTQDWRISTTLTKGPWIVGAEYDTGRADEHPGLPGLAENGTEASVGYVVNSNLQLTLGWQRLHFERGTGVFYNGESEVAGNAVFLHTALHI
ncbi:MAG TPA: porin [Rhizomicrobium sp.]|nr:porin [Rhizomicrobium sp.]